MHFFNPYLEVLTMLLSSPAGAPKPGIHMPLQQISPSPTLSTKRKGLEDVPKDDPAVPSALQRSKRLKSTAKRQWPNASETVVAGRTRSSAKTSSPETDPSEKATSKIKEGRAESAPTKKKRLRKKTSAQVDSENTVSTTEHNPIELDDYFEEEAEAANEELNVPEQEPEHEASLRTPEKPRSPIIQSTPPTDPIVEPESVNVQEEEEDKDLDSLFKSAQDLLKAATSSTSGSGLGSTSQSEFTLEEVNEAKTALRMALLQSFKAGVHPTKASNIKKAMDVLVKAKALEIEETSLQYFQKEFPNMMKSHDSSTHELNKINVKLAELDLKEDVKANEANITATSNEIQDLKTKLVEAEGRLDGLQMESKKLAKYHDELKAGSKSQKMKLNLLVEEVPSLRGQRETLEVQLASFDTSWEKLKNNLEGLL
ncbi:uncharacterized protein LOC131302922 [Rhododendron vialii]|uniref:uncharacterized protein LOC131302922 n=1 Tax=Rhododendron vialii TaxID=182163 RepID=UPI00265F2F6F|nr:uncharacterized protein LOC131302922 [Rhododendron vialii]